MPPPQYINNQNNNLLPIDPLGLPMLSLPVEHFDPLYGVHTNEFTYATVDPAPTTANDQLQYVPLYSLTSHPLNANPLFYFNTNTQQFVPLDPALQLNHIPSSITYSQPDRIDQSAVLCESCHHSGHKTAKSKKCHNYQ
ncbi:hypothetical protein BKA57DRAFT_441150 [Linnemannia elongata]|nr:hypothetical protein BKA57DRAFT_441150 [Linnemannia elongata]